MNAKMTWIGTSWKMNKTIAESLAYVRELASADFPTGIQPFIIPPHTALASVRAALPADSRVLLGAQNAHWAREGAFTGEVSMSMIADAGARIVELGHSERRAMFAETDQTVGLKVRAAIDAGLIPLICVGESSDQRDIGLAEETNAYQALAAIARLTPQEASQVIVAYEPVWAIGEHGRPATLAETSPVMAALAAAMQRATQGAGCRALLYGGSVNPENTPELLADPNTDGLFIGRSAWSADGLLRIIGLAAAARS